MGSISNGLKILTGTLLALLAAESLSRQVFYGPRILDSRVGMIFKPGHPVVRRIEGGAVSHWTVHGIRRKEHPAAVNHRPILVLGDSFTEALQVSDEDVFTAQLERMLACRGIHNPVLNAGESGYSLAHYIGLAETYKKLFNPAWVIVQIGERDLGLEAWQEGSAKLVRKGRQIEAQLQEPFDPARLNSWRRAAFEARNQSALAAFSLKRVQELKDWWAGEPPLFNAGRAPGTIPAPEVTDVYPIEEEIEALCRAYEGRITILYITPFFDPASPARTSPIDRGVENVIRQKNVSWIALYPLYETLAKQGIAVSGFNNTRPFRGHWNKQGHHAIAGWLAQEIQRIAATHAVF